MNRYLDAEWLKEHTEFISYEGMWHETETGEFVSRETMEEAPSIDICFCRECSKHNTHRCHMAFDLIATEDDDFCSYGERSGKPNNCETCKWWEGNTNFCYSKADSDDHACHYEPKDKWREERSSE